MAQPVWIANAKLSAKGRVTIPKAVRDILGISCGDSVVFLAENGSVSLCSAVSAMRRFQTQMQDAADGVTDGEIAQMIENLRRPEGEEGPSCPH